jgi:hypothetical protein
MKKITLVLAMFCVLSVSATLAAQTGQTTQMSAEYSWHGELVALDENARMLTVKSPVVGEHAPAELKRFKAGERIQLGWSGFDKYADAVNKALRLADKAEDRFTFPAEFVAFDDSRRYVTFKLQIPQNGVASLKSLKPGEWITATSPHGASSKTTPVVAIRPYVGGGSASTD